MISGLAAGDGLGEGLGLLGPYRITGVLGRGGMGVVYRGEHVSSGTPAAIKTVRTARPDLLAGIRREIQTLASVSHAGVVDVLDYGIEDGLPWYAMEMLVGQTLRDWISPKALESGNEVKASGGTLTAAQEVEASRRSEVLPPRVTRLPQRRTAELLGIVRGVCSALAHLHSAGIVHRDLKPENVFVRSDGSPILVDLGISTRFSGESGREALEAYVGPIGSLQYMSPEQIRGEFVDARADLYALGCVLYECVTGEAPFFGLPRSTVLTAHLEQRPPSVSSLVDGVAPELDLLISRLLEKEPHNRLGYAEDVARILNGVCEEKSPKAALPAPVAAPAPYVYRPPFVGRRVTLEILDLAIRKLKDRSQGETIYLGGESGVGKTRVTMEATRMATQRGLRVIVSQCTRLASVDEGHANGLPLHVFAPVLLMMADHCREHGDAETQRLFGVAGRVLVNYQPALADAPGFLALPDPGALEPAAARERVLNVMRTTLLAFADLRPFLFLIDDLQWADELSIEVLARLPSASTTTGLLTVATYRPEEGGPKLRQLVNEPGVRQILLDRFGLGEVSALLRGMLALEQSPMPLASALERKCNGNPFFIIEYLRSAIGQGLLRRDAGRWQLGPGRDLFDFLEESVAVPPGVGMLVEQRLHDLDAEAQHLVQFGAVLGREFAADLLFSSTGIPATVAADAMRLLRERHIFEDSDGGGLRFVHDVIRETAYRRIPEARSRELHSLAASAIESRSGTSEHAFKSLGHHFARAQLHDRASSYYRRAAEYAATMFANDDAIACYRSALSEGSASRGSTRGIAVLHEGLGDVLRTKGEQESARQSYGSALRGLRRGVQRARLHRKVGKTWETHHAHDEALEAFRRAATALGERSPERDDDWWQELIQLSLDRMWVHYWLNRASEMHALIEESRDSLMERGSRFQRARFLQLVVMLRIRRERYLVSEETVRLAREAFDLGAELSEAERAALHFVVFFTLVLAGAVDAADVEGQAVLAWANRAGTVTLQARCLTYLMVVARRKSEVERVKQLASDCEAACAHSQLAEYTGALLANRSWAALREERYDEARELAQSALTAWRTVRVPYPMQWMALFPLLALAVQGSRVDEAVGFARALLVDDQQLLPEELSLMLDVSGPGSTPLDELSRAVELAGRLNYL